MKLRVSSGGVPVGSYTAKFLGVEPYQDKDNKYGPGLRWKWQIDKGPQANQIAARITSPGPTARNACGKVLSGLLGQPLKPDDEIDVETFVGKTYLIVVGQGESGTRVDAVMLPPAA